MCIAASSRPHILKVNAGNQWFLSAKSPSCRRFSSNWSVNPYTNDTVVLARVTLTLLAFNGAQLAKTKRGKKLTQTGIRRLRRHLRREVGIAPFIVFAAGAYGIFDIEEVMVALGKPPLHFLHEYSSVQLE